MSRVPTIPKNGDLRLIADWYMRKGHRRVWFVPQTLGLVALIAVFILRGSMEDPRENYAQSRAAVEALVPAPVPQEENAWESYQGAYKVRVMYSGNDDNNPFYRTDDDTKYFVSDEVQALWRDNAKAVELLQHSGEMQSCNFGLDQIAMPYSLPSLLPIREFSNLLALDARCNAHAGNHIAAAKSLHAIRNLARHLESEPLILTRMVASAINASADEAFAAIITFDTPEKIEDLQAYKNALQQTRDPFELMARCVKYESTICIYYLDSFANGKIANARFLGGNLHPSLAPLWYGSDRSCYKAVSDAAIEALRNHRMPESGTAAIQRHQSGPAVITQIVIPSYSRSTECLITYEERSRLSVVAAAFLQYRTKYGRDAVSIKNLMPEFLPSMPHGIFHDQPIRMTFEKLSKPISGSYSTLMDEYYKERPSIRIYTVGKNGIDEFGNSNFEGLPINPDDVIFHIPLPKGKPSR